MDGICVLDASLEDRYQRNKEEWGIKVVRILMLLCARMAGTLPKPGQPARLTPQVALTVWNHTVTVRRSPMKVGPLLRCEGFAMFVWLIAVVLI